VFCEKVDDVLQAALELMAEQAPVDAELKPLVEAADHA